MSTDPTPGAPPSAPASEQRVVLEMPAGKTTVEAAIAALKDLLPAAALTAAVPLLILHGMPEGNEKTMLTVVGALAGFLTGRATAPKGGAQ